MGGLTKELLEAASTALFDPDRALFCRTQETGTLYPHPLALQQPSGAALLTLAGALVAKAFYEGILLQAPLAPFFLARIIQGRMPSLDDLSTLDPDVHRNLLMLKRYKDAAALMLDFTVEHEVFGTRCTEELIPGGSTILVNNDNKMHYVHLMADWHLRKRVSPAAVAFAKGFDAVMPAAWLKLFTAKEANELLGGVGGDSGASMSCEDVEDLRVHASYSGGYYAGSKTVRQFWKVLRSISPQDRSMVLRFATSSSRAPLGGFRHLHPPFTLQKVAVSGDGSGNGVGWLGSLVGGAHTAAGRLPSASTCSNTLKLPDYRSEKVLRDKLMQAIRSYSGFDLS